jgi:hypothetical protein
MTSATDLPSLTVPRNCRVIAAPASFE